MILRITLLMFVAAFYIFGVNGQTKEIFSKGKKIVMPNIQGYFKECGVSGTIAIYDNGNDIWFVSDTSDSKIERVPASTFKIINMLIALETNTIKDENAVVKWPGSIDTIKYGYRPDIYRDISVKEAFQVSAGWAFIELAKKIDRSTYQKFLGESGYGNVDLTEKGEDFWNFGAMGISPINQVEFLKRLYDGNLPFSGRNMDIVKKVMITEKDKDFIIRSKTGWTREHNTNTGWWVGYLESGQNVYFFATRLIQDRKFNRSDFSSCRKEITKKVFRDLKIMQ